MTQYYGWYIRGAKIIQDILTHRKTVETRFNRRLDAIAGTIAEPRWSFIIQSGRKTGPRIVALCMVSHGAVVSPEWFDRYRNCHQITPDSPWYPKDGRSKHLYNLHSVIELPEPIQIPPIRGGNRTCRDVTEYITPELTELIAELDQNWKA